VVQDFPDLDQQPHRVVWDAVVNVGTLVQKFLDLFPPDLLPKVVPLSRLTQIKAVENKLAAIEWSKAGSEAA
jgi:hypothetical protein